MKKALLLGTCAIISTVYATTPRVISSIYPLQQIANAIVGEPTELVADSYLSPHDYAIKPSKARDIMDADIALWIGGVMMPQLDKYMQRRQGTTITAAKLPNIKLLPADKNHSHDHHGHADEHEQAHEHEHAEKQTSEHHHEHDKKSHSTHDEHADHNHNQHEQHDNYEFAYDPHLWLSMENANVIAKALMNELVQKDPENKDKYYHNWVNFQQALAENRSFIAGNFESNPAPNYFVFHDAYRYFEKDFGLENSGVIRLHAGQTPKTRHLNDLKQQLTQVSNACLFREPQFNSPIVDKLAADTSVRIAVLDPVGYQKNLNGGYYRIIRNIATQIATCSQTQSP